MTDKAAVRLFIEQDGIFMDKATEGSAGVDVGATEDVELAPGEAKMLHTGIYMELPPGVECQVRPRSGLALKKGLTVLNTPGTIDSDYRGECNVILINHSKEVQMINKGDRIAQFVFNQYLTPRFEPVHSKEDLSKTSRGSGGFGSTGG